MAGWENSGSRGPFNLYYISECASAGCCLRLSVIYNTVAGRAYWSVWGRTHDVQGEADTVAAAKRAAAKAARVLLREALADLKGMR